MWLSRFRGGVHPDGFKELSTQLPIKQLPLPDKLYVPLRQHAGSEAVPIVQPGDKVLKGQMIGKATAGLSSPVHAPTSGTIKAVTDIVAAHPSGMTARAIIIDVDGEDTALNPGQLGEPFSIRRELLAQKIADAGIVGMGGASFPAAVKLQSSQDKEIETLIINGAECEPYLTADDSLMRERPEEILLGARLISYIIKASRIVVAIEDNKKRAISAMKAAARDFPDLAIKSVPTIYPMGSAKQMIRAVTEREVPAGGRSSDIGVLMHNVGTAYAIARCLTQDEPLISRIVTVSGGAIAKPQNVEARIGTPIEYLIAQCGGTVETPKRLLLGGPMMGQIMPSGAVPLIKGAAGVLALKANEIAHHESSPCIRCGRCVEACPMGLLPLEMAKHSKHQDFDGALENGLSDCILCGSCAYVCPSHIPLVHHFQYAKGEVSQQKAAQKRTEYTRSLSESKRARIEQEAAAKAAAKAAKAKRKKRPAKAAAD